MNPPAWILTKADLGHFLEVLGSAPRVVFDLETTGLDEHAPGAKIVLAGFTVHPTGDTYEVPLAHPDSPWSGRWHKVMGLLAKNLRDAQKPISGHNVKFDCRWVHAHTGIDLSHLIAWDTQISSHLLDENSSTKLKERAPVTFDIERWDDGFDFSKVNAMDVSLIDLGTYCGQDTYWTWRLEKAHREALFLTGEEPTFHEEVQNARLGRLATLCAMPMVATLTAIEQRGIGLDADWTRERLDENEAEAALCFKALATRYEMPHDIAEDSGVHAKGCLGCAEPSFAPTSLYFKAWAEVAVDAGDLKVAALTPGGKPQWNRKVLVRQEREGSQAAVDLLNYRKMVKQNEYLRSWLANLTPAGRVHANYNAGKVVTGRLSSCVTEDTLIDMPRDLVKYPEGVPITKVKPGDWIYSFDWQRHLTLRQVEWVGQTGIRTTVVVTFRNGEGHERVLRCTPDHLVRLRNGDWRPAGTLLRNYGRGEEAAPRVMTMVRRGFDPDEGYVYFFPNSVARQNGSRGGGKNKEHRWVVEQMLGKRLSTKLDVHHRNGTKIDNTPTNLVDLTMSEHRALGRGHARYGEKRETPDTYLGPTDYRVVSVEAGPTEPVWDVTIPVDHQFVANGIVVHNSDPNMQQVTSVLKPAFVPSPGYYVADFDYSQIELRIAAHISGCKPMIEAFKRGDDLHTLLASQITGKPQADVLPQERQWGKSANFGLLYQIGVAGFRDYAESVYGISFTMEQAQKIYDAFFATWDGIAQWHLATVRRAQRDEEVTSPLGRVRRVPDINSANERLSSGAERVSINSPVQGMASDLMQMAAASIEGTLPGYGPVSGARIVGTVHDSIVVEIERDNWEKVAAECLFRMTSMPEVLKRFDVDLAVPLTAEVKVGSRWGLSDIGTIH